MALGSVILAQPQKRVDAQLGSYVYQTFNITANTTSTTQPVLAVNGQNWCTITFDSQTTASAATVTVLGSSAPPSSPTFATLTTFGTSGVITNPSASSAYSGSPIPTGGGASALQALSISVTGLTGGILHGFLSCQGVAGLSTGSGGGSSGTVAQGTGGASAWLITGSVTAPTPAPLPSCPGATSNIGCVGIVSPSATPLAIGSNGQAVVGFNATPQPVYQSAVTGSGYPSLTATPEPFATTGATQLAGAAKTVSGMVVSWAAPSSAGTTCYVQVYNSASAPGSIGSGWSDMFPINISAPGVIAYPFPPTTGAAFSSGLWFYIATAPTGSTSCNTTSNQMWAKAWGV
jgi:hypothetical protein